MEIIACSEGFDGGKKIEEGGHGCEI